MAKTNSPGKSFKLCGMCGLDKDDPALPLCDRCIAALREEISQSSGRTASVEEAVECFKSTDTAVNYAEEQQNTAYLTALYSAIFIAALVLVQYFVWGSSGPIFILLVGLSTSLFAFGIVMYKTENIHLSSVSFSVCFAITLWIIQQYG